ncbi:unnamed protein product [Orchesella dallaii]|uniref:Gustatory receptor n=1 Tax=Orchesella dallaii TaxID=48710 RepID=A0ABP1R2X3_9HEXA
MTYFLYPTIQTKQLSPIPIAMFPQQKTGKQEQFFLRTATYFEVKNFDNHNNQYHRRPFQEGMLPFSSPKSSSSNHHNILSLYFTFGYYCLLFPFKPKFNSLTHQFTLERSNKLHRFLCLFVVWLPMWVYHISFITLYVNFFRMTETFSAKHYFWMTQAILYVIKYIMFRRILLTKHDEIEKVLNLTISSNSTQFLGLGKSALAYLVSIYIIFFSVLVMTSIYYDEMTFFFLRKPETWETLQNNARQRLYVKPGGGSKWIFVGVELYLLSTYYLGKYFVELFFYTALPFTFWSAMKEFEKFYSKEFPFPPFFKSQAQELIWQRFNHLKSVSDGLNRIWANLALMWILEQSNMVVMFLHSSFLYKNICQEIWIISFLLFLVVALWLMAESECMVARFRQWLVLRRNRERFLQDEEELEALLKILEAKPIGVGVTGFYRVSYGFLAELFIMLLTLFLLSFDN